MEPQAPQAKSMQLSVLSHVEPRPGENTYTRRNGGGYAYARPNIQDLRMPTHNLQKVEDLFSEAASPGSPGRDGADESLEAPETPIRPNPRTNSFVETPQTPFGGNGVVENEAGADSLAEKFGMWDGVFARCLLNIFGVIMFLRIPWVVAYAGIWNTLLIILCSVAITAISATSLSAICTNGLVANGGAYYMISRSLGPEFGGAIGLMFFIANAVGCPMYLVGFAETIVGMAGGEVIMVEGWDLQLVGILSLIFICVICFAGLKYVIKFQLGLLALLTVSILFFIIGVFMPHDDLPAYGGLQLRNLVPDWDAASAYKGAEYNGTFKELLCEFQPPGAGSAELLSAQDTLKRVDKTVTFGVALAVFFPAVTGIMAGANISGDLKDPSYAIPKGTNLALFVSTGVYMLLAVLVAFSGVRSVSGLFASKDCPYGGLFHDSLYMARISLWPPMVYAGIFASTLSSAIASLVGAPRILQAVAEDRLFPGFAFLAKGYGVANEPIAAYFLTMIITIGCILIGDLNAIAPLITNFFMASYALTNLACYQASASKTPGWRPTFKHYNKYVSLFGTLACVGFMLFLNLWMAFATIVIGFALYTLVHKLEPDVNWGSAGAGAKYVVAHRNIVSLASTQGHVKNWRPQILALTNGTDQDDGIVLLLRELRKGHGISIIGSVLTSTEETVDGGIGPKTLEEIRKRESHLKQLVGEKKAKAFVQVTHAKFARQGCYSMIQNAGLGPLKPNTFICVFPENWSAMKPDELRNFVGMLGDAFDFGYGVIILRRPEVYAKGAESVRNAEKATKRVIQLDELVSPKKRTSVVNSSNLEMPGDISSGGNKNCIDVWWLSDDGGLTLLLPHLIARTRRRHKIPVEMRVMNTIGEDELGRAGRELTRLDALVNDKFRIGASIVNVILEKNAAINETSVEKIKEQWASVRETIEGTEGGATSDEEISKCIKFTQSRLQLGETIAAKSQHASLVIINVPVPRKDKMGDKMYPYMYMSWLETLSQHSGPSLLVHGSNIDCLTFYS